MLLGRAVTVKEKGRYMSGFRLSIPQCLDQGRLVYHLDNKLGKCKPVRQLEGALVTSVNGLMVYLLCILLANRLNRAMMFEHPCISINHTLCSSNL